LSGLLVSWMRFDLSTSWTLNYHQRHLLNFAFVVIKSLFTVQLSWLRCSMVFLSPSRQMPGECLKVGHDCFYPHPLQIIIR
jgi:hypothetical protein